MAERCIAKIRDAIAKAEKSAGELRARQAAEPKAKKQQETAWKKQMKKKRGEAWEARAELLSEVIGRLVDVQEAKNMAEESFLLLELQLQASHDTA